MVLGRTVPCRSAVAVFDDDRFVTADFDRVTTLVGAAVGRSIESSRRLRSRRVRTR